MRRYSNTAVVTTLAAPIGQDDDTITLADATGWPEPEGDDTATAAIEGELIEYTSRTGAVLSGVTRGVDGTTAASHAAGVQVQHAGSMLALEAAGDLAAEVEFALAGKADAEHQHPLADLTDAGTAAARDVPASGDAAEDEVVLGDDSRLTDARTPAAHASSHGAGQADAIAPGDIGAASVSDLSDHVDNKANPHDVTAAQVGAYTTGEVDDLLGDKASASDLSDHVGDTANPHGVTAEQAGADPSGTAVSAVLAHASVTTSVHGIADTSALETKAGAQSKVDARVPDPAEENDGRLLVVEDGALVYADPAEGGGDVTSVNGQTGVVVLDAEDVGAASTEDLGSHTDATTGVHGIADTSALVLTDDSRLTDSRAPTGGAGGVLSGTYPNPGFAVDMATQAELDAGLSGKADASALTSHTSATTSVHGIADTSALETQTGAQSKADAAQAHAVQRANHTGSQAISTVSGLQSALDAKAPILVETNAQTGTTYTLVLSDAGKVVSLANADPVTLTIPTDAAVALPVGTVVSLYQGGEGQVTVTPDTGVTLYPDGEASLRAQHSEAVLRKVASDAWVISGDVAGGAAGLPDELLDLDIVFSAVGQPGAGVMLHPGYRRTGAYTVAEDLAGSQALARVASTATAVFSVRRIPSGDGPDESVEIGTVTFAAASFVGVFASDDPVTFNAGDTLLVEAPADQDSTLADVAITIRGRLVVT